MKRTRYTLDELRVKHNDAAHGALQRLAGEAHLALGALPTMALPLVEYLFVPRDDVANVDSLNGLPESGLTRSGLAPLGSVEVDVEEFMAQRFPDVRRRPAVFRGEPFEGAETGIEPLLGYLRCC